MNAAQVHLALNHLPILVPAIGIVILAVGLWARSPDLRKAGLALLLLGAVAAIPTFLSGEPTEALAKNYPGVSRIAIHEHEAAARTAFIVLEVAGAGALLALVLLLLARKVPVFIWAVVLLVSTTSFGLFLNAAHLGGLIRHEEIRTPEDAARIDYGGGANPATRR